MPLYYPDLPLAEFDILVLDGDGYEIHGRHDKDGDKYMMRPFGKTKVQAYHIDWVVENIRASDTVVLTGGDE